MEKIRYFASITDKWGELVIGPPLHPDWICVYPTGFADHVGARPRVMTYVNWWLKSLRPAFKTNVVRHCDIMLLSLQTPFGEWNMLNIYSDPEDSSAIRYLADRVADLRDIGCMVGDFNCWSFLWDDSELTLNSNALSIFETAVLWGLESVIISRMVTHHARHGGERFSLIDLVLHLKGSYSLLYILPLLLPLAGLQTWADLETLLIPSPKGNFFFFFKSTFYIPLVH